MPNALINATVATGDHGNILPYVAVAVAALVLVVVLCLPAFKKKPTDKNDKNDGNPNE